MNRMLCLWGVLQNWWVCIEGEYVSYASKADCFT